MRVDVPVNYEEAVKSHCDSPFDRLTALSYVEGLRVHFGRIQAVQLKCQIRAYALKGLAFLYADHLACFFPKMPNLAHKGLFARPSILYSQRGISTRKMKLQAVP